MYTPPLDELHTLTLQRVGDVYRLTYAKMDLATRRMVPQDIPLPGDIESWDWTVAKYLSYGAFYLHELQPSEGTGLHS